MIILIENRVYKVSRKEGKKLQSMQKDIDVTTNKDELELYEYLEENSKHYKFIGVIEFDHRL